MLRITIVGLGMAVQPHARSLADLKDSIEVRWAASPTPARTEAFAARYGFPVTNDVAAAIADPAVDAVLLLTPPNTHLELAQQALAAGKHLLIEKPLDITLDRAAQIVDGYRAADLRLGVVLQHRFRPGAQRLAELLRSGELGEVQAASLSIPWWRPQSYYDEPGRGTLARDGGGVLLSQGIHSLDLFRSLFGPVEVQAAQVRTTVLHRMETEDFAAALLRLGGGASGAVMATTAFYPGHAERIEAITAGGAAQLAGGALAVDWLDGRAERIGDASGGGGGASPMDFPHDAHRALIEDFRDAVAEGREPAVSGAEALASQRLIVEILQRARQG